MTKYHSRKKVELDGEVFDSQAEAQRYQELLLLQRSGIIADLMRQPKFALSPGVTRVLTGKKLQPITFTPDFQYTENGLQVVEDVKGGKATSTEAFRIRLRLWCAEHQDKLFRVTIGEYDRRRGVWEFTHEDY